MNNPNISKLGTLVLAANSLGTISDIPARSLEAVRDADLVVFEEARKAREILKSAGVHREFLLFSEHRQPTTVAAISEALAAGQTVVYMSDQGCPSLQDPGWELARLAHQIGARVTVIPGPSSLTSAISACPFDCRSFHFAGFLPREQNEREAMLKKLGTLQVPIVLMDTPYRLQHVLESCNNVLGENAQAFIAAEIGGEDEAFHAGSFKTLRALTRDWPKQRNFVLVVDTPISNRVETRRR
jgi:16S rRNA (cytidine1402-2'-O)-methyltransferase